MKKAPNTTDVHIGSRVRMRRLMLGMNQTQLGEALGVTFQQVQKNEKGTNRIGSSRLHQIAEILGVSASFFFRGSIGFRVGRLGGRSNCSLGISGRLGPC